MRLQKDFEGNEIFRFFWVGGGIEFTGRVKKKAPPSLPNISGYDGSRNLEHIFLKVTSIGLLKYRNIFV